MTISSSTFPDRYKGSVTVGVKKYRRITNQLQTIHSFIHVMKIESIKTTCGYYIIKIGKVSY